MYKRKNTMFWKSKKKKMKMKEEQERFREELLPDEAAEELAQQSFWDHIRQYFSGNMEEIVLAGLYILFSLNLVVLVVRIVLFFITLDAHYIWNSGIYTLVFAIAPFICWVLATEHENFNYRNFKIIFLGVFTINALLLIISPLLLFGLYAICPYVLKNIVISEVFSYSKAIWLCRFAVLLLPAFVLLLFGKILYAVFLSDFCKDTFLAFKLSHVIDMRKDKEYLYDLTIVHNLDTGKPITVQESDRSTHFTVIGQTGTGKTATGFYPAIVSDLNQKICNDDTREKALLKMVREGKAILNLPEGYTTFRSSYIVPKKKFEKEYQNILKKYKTCCIIAVAPDNDLCDGVARLALARGITPKFIDPTLESEPERFAEFGQYLAGLNPFAVPTNLKEDINAEAKFITEATKNVATILEMIDSRNGKGDRFFTSVNRNITSVVSSITILYCTHVQHRNATWSDVQRALLDFNILRTMLNALEVLFGNSVGRGRGKADGVVDPAGIVCGQPGTESHMPLQYTPWEATFNYVWDELLSETGAKVKEYAYGLRNMVNEFLANPYVKRLFSTPDENCIQIGNSFENGDIIVVNYGLKLGTDTAIATGLAFQLMVNHAMLNRTLPKDRSQNPSPVFEYVDEMPVILSADWLEPLLALGRKYGLVLFSAMQTTAQLDKNETSKYLKNLLLGVGTIICFGRASTEEMKTLSDLAGMENVEILQRTSSSSSLMEENPTSSLSVRTMPDKAAVIEGSDIRNRDFTEVTVLTMHNHRVLAAQLGKTHFLKPSDWNKVPRRKVNWTKISRENPLMQQDRNYLAELEQNAKKINSKPFRVVLEDEEKDLSLPSTTVSDPAGILESVMPTEGDNSPNYEPKVKAERNIGEGNKSPENGSGELTEPLEPSTNGQQNPDELLETDINIDL